MRGSESGDEGAETEGAEGDNRTHLPYRNWCPRCERAKGKDLDHRKDLKGSERRQGLIGALVRLVLPRGEFGYKLAVPVARERTKGMTMATVVVSKGSTGKFIADKVMDFIA